MLDNSTIVLPDHTRRLDPSTEHSDLLPQSEIHSERYSLAAPLRTETAGLQEAPDLGENSISGGPSNHLQNSVSHERGLVSNPQAALGSNDTLGSVTSLRRPLLSPDIESPAIVPGRADQHHDTTDTRPTSRRSYSSQGAPPRSGEVVSPMPGEDQAGMLSRLLSVAAAATAASLVGHDNRQALRDAREVAVGNANAAGSTSNPEDPVDQSTSASQMDSDLVDGSFDGFLAALQSGRLAQALRNGGNVMGGGASEVGPQQPLNFFRMFRFSNAVSIHGSPPSVEGEGRMIPIIIVGIRSIPSREEGAAPSDGIPPFFDSLGSFEGLRAENGRGTAQSDADTESTAVENIHEPRVDRDSTSENQRHLPVASPPEATDIADIEGSTLPAAGDAVTQTGVDALSGDDVSTSAPHSSGRSSVERTDAGSASGGDPRRRSRPRSGIMDSVMDRLRSFRTESPDPGSNDPENIRRRRRRPTWRPFASSGANDEDSTAGPTANASATRSWIIYVLGGTYPENHPILTTPSLFTESPTYEDMLLLSSLIGPAKPETAAPADIDSAGSTYVIAAGDKQLEERCQICLTDYEEGETCRSLTKCAHYFHKECIDEWLTTGRNNCPLCRTNTAARTQGIAEQPSTSGDSATPGNAPDDLTTAQI